MKKTTKFSPEVRERAVRMMFEQRSELAGGLGRMLRFNLLIETTSGRIQIAPAR